LLVQERFPTSSPEATLATMREFLHRGRSTFGALEAIGIGSFGPLELDTGSSRYGYITETSKVGWRNTDIVGSLTREFSCPIGFDTDVNAAALAEQRWGAARDVLNMVYVTIGTGIGGGVIVQGNLVHGLMHPELGHVYPRRHPLDAGFSGVCPYHGDCMEGVASGPAILARTGVPLSELDLNHLQWEIEADYLGQLCALLVLTLSPQRIVLGGGVMAHERLLPLIRERMGHWLGGYVQRGALLQGVDAYVVPPALGGLSGLLGALALAMSAV
jgi:fructokinase